MTISRERPFVADGALCATPVGSEPDRRPPRRDGRGHRGPSAKRASMIVATAFRSQLVTLVIGFALTTVVGGARGSWFQRQAWDHQNDRSLAESDRDHATQTCRELSQLMDKRLAHKDVQSVDLSTEAGEFLGDRLRSVFLIPFTRSL